MLTERRLRFCRLIAQANQQSTDWLVAVLKDKTHNNGYFTPLARLACLRVVMGRTPNGMCYLQKKRALRRELGI